MSGAAPGGLQGSDAGIDIDEEGRPYEDRPVGGAE